MENDRSLCVICAWRQTCNKKFTVDGATSTRCQEYTRDITLKQAKGDGEPDIKSD